MKKTNHICLFILFMSLYLFSCTGKAADYHGLDSNLERKIDSIIALMTLEEKIGQMNQYSNTWGATGPIAENIDELERFEDIKNGKVGAMLNIASATAIRQAQELVMEHSRMKIPMMFGFDVIHGFSTIFPIPLAEAASWDMDLMERTARVAAIEASATGLNWTFAPMIDISRDARWGRVMEGAGEDPFLGSLAARARIRGFQGNDLAHHNTIAACAKHLAGYGMAIAGRDYSTVEISDFHLFNEILPPFKAAVDEGVATVMNGFNILNGIPVTASQFLVNDILKTRWQFDGFVVSDWATISEMQNHGFTANRKKSALKAAQAMCDMDMESSCYIDYLAELVREGALDARLIDQAVRRILRVKFQLGLFDDPYLYCDPAREDTLLGHPSHHELAYEAALKSIVLLKNENKTLPIKQETIRSIALIGPLGNDKDSPLGNWRANGGVNNAVSLEEGLREKLGPDIKIHAVEACNVVRSNPDVRWLSIDQMECNDRGFEQALAAARKSDIIIAALGETAMMSGEARSRADIGLPGRQQELLEEINKLGKPVILVCFSGRPLVLTWAHYNIAAIVQAWHLGHQSGRALADMLLGHYNPSGKLPVSFPYHVGQVPIAYNNFSTGRPKTSPDDIYVSRYSDIPNDPLYPFGHGLGYSEFEYSDLHVSTSSMNRTDTIVANITIKNNGKYAGEETVQLYIRNMAASFVRPVKELKGFTKVWLEPGQSKQVSLNITPDLLSYYDPLGNLLLEEGEYKIFIGTSSALVLEERFSLN